MKWVIGLVFVAIVASLVSAMVFLMRDRGRTRNMVRALGLRVGLSIALFAFVLVANHLGWLQSRGVPVSSTRSP